MSTEQELFVSTPIYHQDSTFNSSLPKIAVCISGHIRTWFRTHKTFLKYIMPFNPDIFVHTYDQLDWWRHYPANFPSTDEKDWAPSHTATVEQINEMLAIVNPVVTVIENYDDILKNITDKHYSTPIACQWRKTYLCDKLRLDHEEKTGIKYDWIIRTRFDIDYVNTPEAIMAADKNIFHLGPKFCPNHNLNDQFAMLTPEQMKIFVSIYDRILSGDFAQMGSEEMLRAIFIEFKCYWNLNNICSGPQRFTVEEQKLSIDDMINLTKTVLVG